MNKYKIAVYAICKNEEKFVDRWYDAVKDADAIYVLDTGSSDNTLEKLKQKEKIVVKQEIIKPWRFDVARNKSLDMVDKDVDICICLDLDEIIMPNWRNVLEDIWDNNATRLAYTYNWSLDSNDNPLVSFYIEKIHSRFNYKWTHPVHEVLTYTKDNEEIKKYSDILTVNHYPDNTKSRSSYLPLLELSVAEDPLDDRNMHYLGREYMYYQKHQECIDTLIKHLNLKTATWKDERCASMRFIARSYTKLKRYEEAKMWYSKAINEAPYLRDPYVEMALLYYSLEDWNNVIYYCNKALEITYKAKTYINEQFSWDNTIYDLLAISYYHLNDLENAIKNIDIALTYTPDDERLINNKIIFEKMKSN